MNQKTKNFLKGGILSVAVLIVGTITIILFVYASAYGIGFLLITSKELIGTELTIIGLVLIGFFFLGGIEYTKNNSQT